MITKAKGEWRKWEEKGNQRIWSLDRQKKGNEKKGSDKRGNKEEVAESSTSSWRLLACPMERAGRSRESSREASARHDYSGSPHKHAPPISIKTAQTFPQPSKHKQTAGPYRQSVQPGNARGYERHRNEKEQEREAISSCWKYSSQQSTFRGTTRHANLTQTQARKHC